MYVVILLHNDIVVMLSKLMLLERNGTEPSCASKLDYVGFGVGDYQAVWRSMVRFTTTTKELINMITTGKNTFAVDTGNNAWKLESTEVDSLYSKN